MKPNHKPLTASMLGAMLLATLTEAASIQADGDSPFPAGSSITLSINGAPETPEPDGGCCDDTANFEPSGDPTYSWSGDASGSDSTSQLDTSLDDPMKKKVKNASVTITQNWTCEKGADTTTTSVDVNGGPWEVWPVCGEDMFDSAIQCCVDNKVIDHEPLTDPPIINAPKNTGKVSKNIEVDDQENRRFLGIANQVYGGATVRYRAYELRELRVSSARSDTIVAYTHEPSTDTLSVSKCGANLNETFESGNDVKISLAFDAKFKAWGTVDIGPTIDLGELILLRATSTECAQDAEANVWIYFRIFDIYTEVKGVEYTINGYETDRRTIFVYEGDGVEGHGQAPEIGHTIDPHDPVYRDVVYSGKDENATSPREKTDNQLCEIEVVSCCDNI